MCFFSATFTYTSCTLYKFKKLHAFIWRLKACLREYKANPGAFDGEVFCWIFRFLGVKDESQNKGVSRIIQKVIEQIDINGFIYIICKFQFV